MRTLRALNEPSTLDEVASAMHTLRDGAGDFRILRDRVERSLRYLVTTGRLVKMPTRPATYMPAVWQIDPQPKS
jgi:hypothetical protein